ncbi:MAG TPA: glucuronyl hydrolase [Bacteroidota bacterium]|nr:glucuronyl hydrolase [Bacteroidota bacterium]
MPPVTKLLPKIVKAGRRFGKIASLLAVATFTFVHQATGSSHLDSLVNDAVKISLEHLERSVSEVADSTLFPSYGTPQLKWKLTKSSDWTSGFYPGCLWYAFELSHDSRFESWARSWTGTLEKEKLNKGTHDLGFMMLNSFGNGLRLEKGAAPGNYKDILLTSALTFSSRYSKVIGCLSSDWDIVTVENSFPVIIDIMMDIELLFWASVHGGPEDLAEYARSHALVSARDLVRTDGSTYHIVRYDKKTGAILSRGTMQGEGDETTWSRGQAWGLYGMVMSYRYTKDERFLKTATRLADYFLSHLKGDHVAPWDFQSKIDYRDVSATAIATSALFELVMYVKGDTVRSRYQTEAESMLGSLCSASYFTDGKQTSCLLDHAVQYLPIHSNVDVPSIFADYYFLEALVRYKAQKSGSTIN